MIIYFASIFILCIISLIFSKYITRSLNYLIIFSIFPVILIFLKSENIWIFSGQIVYLILLVSLLVFIQSKITYDFSGKIISIKSIFYSFFVPKLNKQTERIIGRVVPYNNYQLRYNGQFITMNEVAATGSMLVSGATGSGKTYGLKSLIRQNIDNRRNVIMMEYKGDKELVNDLAGYGKQSDYDVYVLSQGKSNFNYDPLQNLNNVGRIEAIINMRKWSLDGADAHYRTSVQLLLQNTIREFSHIYEKMKASGKKEPYTYAFYKYLKTYNPRKEEWDAYATTSKLLELLITSSLKPMFTNQNGKTLDFVELHKNQNKKFLIIISFISSNKELATSFSSLMIKDILDVMTVHTFKDNVYIYQDEFGTLENPFIVKDLIEKGRSAKLAITLALQDINQIVIQTNEAYLNSLLGTINTFIVYSGATKVTAEKFAGVQLLDIESVLMNLRKPVNGKKPTAIYISKYPTLNRRINSEVFRFEPYIHKESKVHQPIKKNIGIFEQEHKVIKDEEKYREEQIKYENKIKTKNYNQKEEEENKNEELYKDLI